eukprot:5953875-Amphidinium_carterae.1
MAHPQDCDYSPIRLAYRRAWKKRFWEGLEPAFISQPLSATNLLRLDRNSAVEGSHWDLNTSQSDALQFDQTLGPGLPAYFIEVGLGCPAYLHKLPVPGASCELGWPAPWPDSHGKIFGGLPGR